MDLFWWKLEIFAKLVHTQLYTSVLWFKFHSVSDSLLMCLIDEQYRIKCNKSFLQKKQPTTTTATTATFKIAVKLHGILKTCIMQ